MEKIRLWMLYALAPFIGLGLALYTGMTPSVQAALIPAAEISSQVEEMEKNFNIFHKEITALAGIAVSQEQQFKGQDYILESLGREVSGHKELSDQIYEDKILNMLGEPVKVHKSNRVEIKVFTLNELGYRGYIAKVKLFDPTALKVVMGKDTLGEKENTIDAVKRTGAILGINGGGFYTETRDGKPYGIHIGNTVIDGKLVGQFNPYPPDLHFVGINKSGRVIGGVFYEEKDFWAINPFQGVSFIPVLIKGGMPRPIHPDWAKTKQPRTIMGEYANGDLIFIVVDGRQSDWSSGVTLETLLEKLAELGVKEGYNLDGGGSSTFVYGNEILNRPSDGKSRPVVTNIVIMP